MVRNVPRSRKNYAKCKKKPINYTIDDIATTTLHFLIPMKDRKK